MLPMPRPVCLLLLCLPTLAVAAHVTDKLVVGLYDEAGAQGTPLRLLSSGTPLEVLNRQDDWVEVRVADDARGWLEARYVTDEKPARAMLLETQARLRQSGIELAALRETCSGAQDASAGADDAAVANAQQAAFSADPAAAGAQAADLERGCVASAADPAAEAELSALRDHTDQALRILAAARGITLEAPQPQPLRGWIERYQVWIIGAAALLLGFAAGIAFVDHRIRRRYGGFRF